MNAPTRTCISILACALMIALQAQGQTITVRWNFFPDPPSQDLYTWRNVGIKVDNDSGVAVDVYPELIIRHNDEVFFHLRRNETLNVRRGVWDFDQYSDFGDPIYDAFSGQDPGTYEVLVHPDQAELAPIVLTRQLPLYKWEFCILLYDANYSLLTEACRTFYWGNYLPPAPILPSMDIVLSRYSPVRFMWSPVVPNRGFVPTVRLQVYEILPGQDEVDAVRSNPAIVSEEVRQQAWWIWDPSAIALAPGDSMQYVWQVTALSPADILTQETGATSQLATFWIKDPRPPVDPEVPPCDTVNAGPDLFQAGPDAPRVTIGCEPKEGCAYEWLSEPLTCHAHSAKVGVRPAQTTRYMLFQTSDSGRCVVYDEVYVVVKTNFKTELKTNPCGEISAVVIPNPEDKTEPSLTRNNRTVTKKKVEVVDTATVANGIPFDDQGEVIGDHVLPGFSCDIEMPPALTPPPAIEYNYTWSTGESTPTVKPKKEGTYSCTVSEGGRRASASTQFEPSSRFRGDFTYMAYTEEMRLLDPQRPFVIKQNGNEDGALPAYNAWAYKVEITGPDCYQVVLESTTEVGFTNGEIRWEGGPDARGVRAMPGTYTCRVSFANCDHPDHSDTRRYNFGRMTDYTEPISQARDVGKVNTFEIKVKPARKSARKEML